MYYINITNYIFINSIVSTLYIIKGNNTYIIDGDYSRLQHICEEGNKSENN